MKEFIKINPDEFKNAQYTVNVKPTGIRKFACGCTIQEPHSHLVYGHECDCEKGNPAKSNLAL